MGPEKKNNEKPTSETQNAPCVSHRNQRLQNPTRNTFENTKNDCVLKRTCNHCLNCIFLLVLCNTEHLGYIFFSCFFFYNAFTHILHIIHSYKIIIFISIHIFNTNIHSREHRRMRKFTMCSRCLLRSDQRI